MEEQDPTGPNSEDVSEGRAKSPYVIHAGNPKEFLERRPGDLMHRQAEEGSLALAQWEAQWQEFLKTVENPHSEWGIPHWTEKPSPWEDAKTFLASFEQVAQACQWPQEEWATRLLPSLSGEAKWAFNSLAVQDRKDYGKVTAAILQRDALSREKQREEFRRFCYQETEGPRGAYNRLRKMCRGWLRVEKHSKEQILELLILEQLLSILPPEIQRRVRESSPESCSQAVTLAEEFLLRQEKQVPLEEEAWSISEAVKALSEGEQRHPSVDVKEEEDREAGPLAGSMQLMDGDLLRVSLENTKEEDSEGNFKDPDRNKRKRDKPIHCQGGGFLEITVQEERATRKRRNEGLHSDQRIHCRKKEMERVAFGNTFIQKMNIVSQEEIHSPEKPYYCLECGKSFSHQTTLALHQRIHPGYQENMEDEKLHQVSLDKAKNQKLKGNLWDRSGHKRQKGSCLVKKRDQPNSCQGSVFCELTHMVKETYKCLECGMDFSDQIQYYIHLRMHNGKKTPKFLECGKSFSCRSELLKHQRIHTAGKPYSCSSCGKSFSQKASLIHHQRIHSEEKPSTCSGNEKNFSDRKKGTVHFPKHSRMKTYKCFQCGQYFRNKSQLFVHHKIHTGEKPFECSECRKKFSQSYHLQRHQRTHTGEKPFECSECGKKFGWSTTLQRHQRTHTGEKPFECSECGKKFGRSTTLQQHQRTHTGEKPFECSECGKKFGRSTTLQQHQRTHMGEKPFECSECGKKFSRNGHLQRHQRTHRRSNCMADKAVTRARLILHTLTATIESTQR